MQANKKCPFCGCKTINDVKAHPVTTKGIQYMCDNCGTCGPVYDNKAEALIGWEQGVQELSGRYRQNK